MAAESTVFGLLSAASAVSALVAARIYPSVRPQEGALPCIVFERVETEIVQTVHGTFVLSLATIRINAISTTLAEADAISDAVRTALAAHTHTERLSTYDSDADVFISATTHIVRD